MTRLVWLWLISTACWLAVFVMNLWLLYWNRRLQRSARELLEANAALQQANAALAGELYLLRQDGRALGE